MTYILSHFEPAVSAAVAFFPLHPPTASTIAYRVDYLYYFLTAFTLCFTFGIFAVIFYFMVKYRRRSDDDVPEEVKTSIPLELAWTLIPAAICAFIFFWSSSLFFRNSRPPANSTEIFVVGKQWMWHLQHTNGAREIDQLHVPIGVPIKLTMTSEDVIHDFFVPAFRVKEDVLPGRYTSIWFQATQLGTFPFECAQMCGALHSSMRGEVIVMKPDDFAHWLSENAPAETMSSTGGQLFSHLGCVSCHVDDTSGRYPQLAGAYGHQVMLRNGVRVTVDESFIRSAIVNPNAQPLAGYAASMPSFQGQIDEVQLLDLIAYIKTLHSGQKEAALR